MGGVKILLNVEKRLISDLEGSVQVDRNRAKLVVGSLIAEPGQSVEGHLKVGNMQDGTPFRLPLVLINGAHGGKRSTYKQLAMGTSSTGLPSSMRFYARFAPIICEVRLLPFRL